MPTAIFDTLQYAKKLKAAGFSEDQAEVLSSTQAALIEERLVTQQYLDLRLKELETSLKADIIKWVAGMLVAQAAIVATLVKLL
ncbi:MAG: DUF1640 domain-containing protein [Deltaproteobacteria bacterium]|nr:DUF1640 domain-containing protein [Deltaproteobacteria bacterium]